MIIETTGAPAAPQMWTPNCRLLIYAA